MAGRATGAQAWLLPPLSIWATAEEYKGGWKSSESKMAALLMFFFFFLQCWKKKTGSERGGMNDMNEEPSKRNMKTEILGKETRCKINGNSCFKNFVTRDSSSFLSILFLKPLLISRWGNRMASFHSARIHPHLLLRYTQKIEKLTRKWWWKDWCNKDKMSEWCQRNSREQSTESHAD